MSSEYFVQFDIKPTVVMSGYRSILHLTTGENSGEHGTRYPAVLMEGSTRKLLIRTSLGINDEEYGYEVYTSSLPMNQFTTITIFQFKVNTTYIYKIWVNGTEVHSKVNPNPKSFAGVKVYAGSPWRDAADAYIRNLSINPKYNKGIKFVKRWQCFSHGYLPICHNQNLI